MAQPPKSKAIERLQRLLDKILEMKQLSEDSPKFEKWQRDTRVAIGKIFGEASRNVKEFEEIFFHPSVSYFDMPDSEFQASYLSGLDSATAMLESMIDEIDEDWPDDSPTQNPSSAQVNDRPSSNEVFVIHGRDEGTKNTVARYLEQLKLHTVILAEQSNQGQTIIEKVEQHAHVGFAVALLTPDDAGSLQTDTNNLSPRARQNVIFELGFFIGRLDRKNVCALTIGEVDIPSDYAGVAYIPLDDSDGWKMKLFKELESAGLPVNPKDMLKK